MRFQGTAIYCTPSEAQSIGTSFQTTVFLSKEQVRQVRDYYLNKQAGNMVGVGALVGVGGMLAAQAVVPSAITLAAANTSTVYAGIVMGVITAMMVDCLDSRADVFDDLYGQNKTNFAMSVTYTYYRHGSYDGAYFISNIHVY